MDTIKIATTFLKLEEMLKTSTAWEYIFYLRNIWWNWMLDVFLPYCDLICASYNKQTFECHIHTYDYV